MKRNKKLNKGQIILAVAMTCVMAATIAGCGAGTKTGSKMRSYDVDKYVTLADYNGMAVEVAGDFDVSDEDVVNMINGMLKYYPTYEDTDKQTVEDGDFVDIDYEGKKDGVAFDGGTAQGYVLEIGSDSFIDGFEDGLIGANVGDTLDLNLTFPENYHSQDLAGADVVFTVTVNKIVQQKDISYDALTDEYVAGNLNYDSVDALFDDMKSSMENDCEQNRITAERAAVLDTLIENSKVSVPDGLLEMKVNQYVQQFTKQNCSDGKTLSDYVSSNYNMTEEDFLDTITKELEANLDDEMVLEALVKAEGQVLDKEGYAEFISSAMKNGSFQTEDDLYAAYDSDYEDGRSYLEHRYLLTNALTNLIEKCNITYTGENASDIQ